MSLSEAMLELADVIEKDLESITDNIKSDTAADEIDFAAKLGMVLTTIGGYSRMIRTAVKAAERTAPPEKVSSGGVSSFSSPDAQHDFFIRQERERIRQERQAVQPPEEGHLVVVEGGAADGTYVPIEGGMPEGAKTAIGGDVYELRGGKLVIVD